MGLGLLGSHWKDVQITLSVDLDPDVQSLIQPLDGSLYGDSIKTLEPFLTSKAAQIQPPSPMRPPLGAPLTSLELSSRHQVHSTLETNIFYFWNPEASNK